MKSKIIVTGIVFLFFVNFVFSGEIHPGLQKHIEKLGDKENVKVIFIFNGKQPKEVLDVMKSEGAKIKRSFSIIDAASADLPKGLIKKFSEKGHVKRVQLDHVTNVSLDVSSYKIGANKVWTNATVSNIDVAVIDTGVYHHSAYTVVSDIDFSTDGNPQDYYGHGTHVSGIIASNDATYKGVAPGTRIMNVKVLNQYGWGYESDVVAGIEYSVNNGAEVISMSLGGYVYPCDGTDAMSLAVDSAVAKGKVVVVAAGNSGPDGNTILSPGCARDALTVGATDDSDAVVWFSSRGSTGDGRTKPDIVAPGYYITSTYLGNGFTTFSGTSMATPHVSGVVALMLGTNNTLTPADVKRVIQSTAINIGYDINSQGAGRVDAYNAWFTVIPKLPEPILNESLNETNRTKRIKIPPGLLKKNMTKNIGLLPDSSAYGFKRFFENIRMFTTLGQLKKCERYLNHADLRLGELKVMIEKEGDEYADSLLRDYKSDIAACDDILQDTKEYDEKGLVNAALKTAKHLDVLEEVKDKVPENAKRALENALQASRKGHDNIVAKIEAREPGNSAELNLRLAEDYLNSAAELTEQGKIFDAEKKLKEYERLLKKAISSADAGKKFGKDMKNFDNLLAEDSPKHLEMILTSYEKAEDKTQVKERIGNVMKNTLVEKRKVSDKESAIERQIEKSAPDVASSSPGRSGTAPGQSGTAPGQSGGQGGGQGGGSSGGSPGNSGSAPGQNK